MYLYAGAPLQIQGGGVSEIARPLTPDPYNDSLSPALTLRKMKSRDPNHINRS